MHTYDRILLLTTGILAAYQIMIGIDHMSAGPICAYTIAFGVLLLAGLLLIILGHEALDSPIVVIAATLIPLGLSTGLVWQYFPAWQDFYLALALFGFAGVLVTRSLPMPKILPVLALILVHGIAGLLITFLPFVLVWLGDTPAGFVLVGVGGALISVGGVLFAFLNAGRPILSREVIHKVLPGLLLLTTTAFVGGFAFG
jgi:hypothetical protein